MFINETEKDILNDLLHNPNYLSYAPERIMAFYLVCKLSNKFFSLNILSKNPISFAKESLSSDDFKNIFLPLYNYFKYLFERRRKIKRKASGSAEIEAETTKKHLEEIIKYCGEKTESLTLEQRKKLEGLASRANSKLNKAKKNSSL